MFAVLVDKLNEFSTDPDVFGVGDNVLTATNAKPPVVPVPPPRGNDVLLSVITERSKNCYVGKDEQKYGKRYI